MPRPLTALFEGPGPLEHGPDGGTEHEHPMTGQQRQFGVAHGLDRIAGRRGHIHTAAVLVDQHQVTTAAESRTLVVHRRDLTHVGTDGAEQRMTVHGHADLVTSPMQLEVQRDPQWRGPVALHHVPVEIDADEL